MHSDFVRMVELGGEVVVTNGGHQMVSPFVVEMTGSELPCDVTLIGEIRGGLAVCVSLELRSTTGMITNDLMRELSIPRLLDEAVNFMVGPGTREELETGRRTPERRTAITADLRSRKHRITSDLLTEVAEIYTNAKSWPTKEVAEQMHVSRSTAATWVGLARKHDPPLLSPARTTDTSSKETS